MLASSQNSTTGLLFLLVFIRVIRKQMNNLDWIPCFPGRSDGGHGGRCNICVNIWNLCVSGRKGTFGILNVETIREDRIGFAPHRSGGEREGESPVSLAYHHTAPAIGVGGGLYFIEPNPTSLQCVALLLKAGRLVFEGYQSKVSSNGIAWIVPC